MKSWLEPQEEKIPGDKYPCLKQSKCEESLVVLFRSPGRGTVVASEDIDFLGAYCTDLSEDLYVPLAPGIRVVLSN